MSIRARIGFVGKAEPVDKIHLAGGIVFSHNVMISPPESYRLDLIDKYKETIRDAICAELFSGAWDAVRNLEQWVLYHYDGSGEDMTEFERRIKEILEELT